MGYILTFLAGALATWYLYRSWRASGFVLKLVRHAQSKANTREVNPGEVGDHVVPLTDPVGFAQATACGAHIGIEFLRDALLLRSPYLRTEQSLDAMLRGAGFTPEQIAGLDVTVDPRLREIEHTGNVTEWKTVLKMPDGWFYYRFLRGESCTDVFDRLSDFLGSMFRLIRRKRAKKVVIVSHGLAIRIFVMRFFHLSVKQFESLANPKNCDVITIAPARTLADPQFVYGNWGVTGLRFLAKD